MTTTATFYQVDPMVVLRDEIVAMIIDRHAATPRHRQAELGPSEIGHPCSRRLAYQLANSTVPACNPQWDPLPSIIGTATHTWLESAATLANKRQYEEFQRECEKIADPETRMFTLDTFQARWLTETKVHPAPWLPGSCDLYDCDTATVVDYKVPGVNQFALLSRNMSPVYRTQVHLYGKGFANLGYDVKTVAVMLIPRGGTLAKSHLWSEPYDEKIATEAMDRRLRITMMLQDLDISVEHHASRFEWFQKVGYQCIFCPFYSPKPNGPLQCSGDGVSPPIP